MMTIIVMLILVGVSISMVVNGGLFEYAGKAVGDTEAEKKKEEEIGTGKIEVNGKSYSIIEIVEGVVPNPEEKFSEIYTENTEITETTADGKTYKAVIPKGFAVGTSSDINSIAKGLVITDKVNSEGQSTGNEFVWIPVTYTREGILDEDGYDTGFKKAFYRSTWKNNRRDEDLTNSTLYKEPLTSGGYDGEVEDYKEMLDSVYQNGGFYIGRYEAGSTTPRTYKEGGNGTTEMVVKRDAYPYNYIAWANSKDYTSDVIDNYYGNQGKGALYLSKTMYANKNVGVTSTLCYGIMWDAMLEFISEEKSVTYSTKWGNYSNSTWRVTRTTAGFCLNNTWDLIENKEENYLIKISSQAILLTTGASDDFAAKNIYDVAGNVLEWTMEGGRVIRGGDINGGGYYGYRFTGSADGRFGQNVGNTRDDIGFRPALYIK